MSNLAKPKKRPSCYARHDAKNDSKYSELHEKNPYRNNPPDFLALSGSHRNEIGQYLNVTDGRNGLHPKAHFDWKNPEAVKQLTKILLLKDFGLKISIPDDHLCPPLPNRLNYLCWLSDILGCWTGPTHQSSSSDTLTGIQPSNMTVLDIGVGPACIYPVLGHRVFGWKFIGSDIDKNAVTLARSNVDVNGLADCIRITQVDSSAPLQNYLANSVPYSRLRPGAARTAHSESGDVTRPSPDIAPAITASSISSSSNAEPPLSAQKRQLDIADIFNRVHYRRNVGGPSRDSDTCSDGRYCCGPVMQAFKAVAGDPPCRSPDHFISNDEGEEGEEGSGDINDREDEEKVRYDLKVSEISAESEKDVTKVGALVAAVMTNPPFYDIDEPVSNMPCLQ